MAAVMDGLAAPVSVDLLRNFVTSSAKNSGLASQWHSSLEPVARPAPLPLLP